MWFEMQLSAQSSLQKLNVVNSCQKHAELDITLLESCPIFLYFFSLCQLFLLGLSLSWFHFLIFGGGYSDR